MQLYLNFLSFASSMVSRRSHPDGNEIDDVVEIVGAEMDIVSSVPPSSIDNGAITAWREGMGGYE